MPTVATAVAGATPSPAESSISARALSKSSTGPALYVVIGCDVDPDVVDFQPTTGPRTGLAGCGRGNPGLPAPLGGRVRRPPARDVVRPRRPRARRRHGLGGLAARDTCRALGRARATRPRDRLARSPAASRPLDEPVRARARAGSLPRGRAQERVRRGLRGPAAAKRPHGLGFRVERADGPPRRLRARGGLLVPAGKLRPPVRRGSLPRSGGTTGEARPSGPTTRLGATTAGPATGPMRSRSSSSRSRR